MHLLKHGDSKRFYRLVTSLTRLTEISPSGGPVAGSSATAWVQFPEKELNPATGELTPKSG